MNLTPSQQNKIEKIAKFLDDSNIATVESFMELDEKLTGLEEKMDKIIDEKTQEIQVIEKECFDFTEVLKKLDEPLEVEVTLNIL